MAQPEFSLEAEEVSQPVRKGAESRSAVVEAQAIQPPATPQAGMIAMIERVLLNDAIPFEKLEKMLEMQERLEANQARKAFDLAISAAKAQIPPIFKDKRVHFDSKSGGAKTDYRHETLAQIAKVIDPILGEFGLSYRYKTQQNQAVVTVTCIVSHREGHSEETVLSCGVDASGNKNAIQAIGSAVSYLQRYTLKAALGLSATEVEDDGRASGRAAGAISDDQFNTLFNLMEEAGADEKFLRIYGVEDLRDLPASVAGAAENVLRQKLAAKKKEGGDA